MKQTEEHIEFFAMDQQERDILTLSLSMITETDTGFTLLGKISHFISSRRNVTIGDLTAFVINNLDDFSVAIDCNRVDTTGVLMTELVDFIYLAVDIIEGKRLGKIDFGNTSLSKKNFVESVKAYYDLYLSHSNIQSAIRINESAQKDSEANLDTRMIEVQILEDGSDYVTYGNARFVFHSGTYQKYMDEQQFLNLIDRVGRGLHKTDVTFDGRRYIRTQNAKQGEFRFVVSMHHGIYYVEEIFRVGEKWRRAN